MKNLKIFACELICVFLLGSSLLLANDLQQLADKVEDLDLVQKSLYQKSANLLRCPTCTGLSVLESDAPFSLQIRDKVVDLINKGFSEAKIFDFFTTRYGVWILRKPPFAGFHAFAWIFPIAFIFLGGFFIWFLFWRKKKHFITVRYAVDTDIIKEMSTRLKKLRD